MPRRRRKRGSSLERFLPLGYVAAAAACAVIILPSALRPPTQQPNQTAELSPDAPPDKNQTAIIGSLNRATSGVAALPGGGTEPTTTTLPKEPPPQGNSVVTVPRACPRGFGNPPRQVESVYAPPCAGPWSGNNGGATWKGVTANEIRIGVRGLGALGGGNGDCDRNGSIDDLIAQGDVDDAVKTWAALEGYFNKNFQLYGRRLSFYCIEPTTQSVADEESEAVAADQESKIFASGWTYSEACVELARRQVISMCPELSDSWYQKFDPYVWSAWPSGTDIVTFTSEMICKQLAGKKAEWAGDTTYQSQIRKFALVTWDDRGYGEDARLLVKQVKEQCNVDMEAYFMHPGAGWGGATTGGDQELAQAATKAKANNVTTMVIGLDGLNGPTFTNHAASQQYFPEWIVNDGGALNANGSGGIENPDEWKHAFGQSGFGPNLPTAARECNKAFASMDQSDTPDYWLCELEWVDLMLLISGIQQAGPNLNPTTFKGGLQSLGMRYWPTSWAMGGGFAGGRHTYSHTVSEIWWDPTAQDPSAQSSVGAMRFERNGKRYCHGQIPSEPSYFKPDPSAVSLPTDFATVPRDAPPTTCPPV